MHEFKELIERNKLNEVNQVLTMVGLGHPKDVLLHVNQARTHNSTSCAALALS